MGDMGDDILKQLLKIAGIVFVILMAIFGAIVYFFS